MASVDSDFKRRRRRVLAGGGIAAALLYGGGAVVFDQRIVKDLEKRVPEELSAQAGVTGVSVNFSGQDGTIECDQPLDDPAKVEEVALGVYGVNKITLADDCRTGAAEPLPTEDTEPPATPVASEAPNYETVADIVSGDPGYQALAARLADSDYAAALADANGGPYTVFAPSTEAFNAVSPDVLAVIESDPAVRDQVLGYHVVDGTISLADMTDGATFTTVSGETLTVTGEGEAATISGAGAKITSGPIEAKNGVVYTIDTVMTPDNLDLGGDDQGVGAVSAVLDTGAITLSGTVASEDDRAVLVDAATRKVGADKVTDNLVVAEGGVGGDQAGSVGQLILGMADHLVSGDAGYKDGGLYVNGQYADDAAKESMTGIAEMLTATANLEPRPDANAETAEDLQNQLNAYVAENPVLFDPSSSNLSAESTAVIDTLAAGLQQLGGLSVVVQGHTDSDGDEATNQALSEQRAAAVVAALVDKGVPADTITSEGFGETQPVLVDGAEDKAASRRVVFELSAS